MFPLARLIPSKTRRSLLSFFFHSEGKTLNVRQVSNVIHISPSLVAGELKNLAEAGILNKTPAGNQILYSLNGKCAMLRELRSVISSSEYSFEKIKERLEKLCGISAAFVFGSAAKGRNSAKSDIDLMIIGKPDQARLNSEMNSLESEIGAEIDYFLFEEGDFRRRAKEGFIKNVIASKKVFLIGDENEFSACERETPHCISSGMKASVLRYGRIHRLGRTSTPSSSL